MSDLSVPGQPVILFAEECDRGGLSEENQDSVLHLCIALGELLIVADGISGPRGGGDVASRMAVEHLYAHLAALPPDYSADKAIRGAVAQANARIAKAAFAPDSPYERMNSTVVLALLQQEGDITNAWIGHIGDSRAYLLRADRLHRLTTDHTAVQSLLNRGLISPEEAPNHPDAAVLTRSLGLQPEVEIEIEQHPLAVGDTLLLCSSGVWGFIPEPDIQAAAAAATVEGVAHNLFELALSAGGQNNIGIEMARLAPPPEPVVSRRKKYHAAAKWFLVFYIVAVFGLCVLAYFTFWAN